MTTLPSPPFIPIPGMHNFRDIGGYTSTSPQSDLTSQPARSVRRGLIFRSADPGKATAEGRAKLRELGIVKVFDLRSVPELKKLEEPVLEIEGIERVFAPVFVEEDYSPEGVALRYTNYTRGPDGFIAAYADILGAASTPKPPAHAAAYTTVFRHILAHPSAPFLIHCTAGKDRTGVLAALLLRLAGARTEDIVAEYNLTEAGLASVVPFFIERLLQNPVLKGNRAGVENMCSAPRESMRGFLGMLDETYGGAEGYLTSACGFTAEEVDRIKSTLVSADPPTL